MTQSEKLATVKRIIEKYTLTEINKDDPHKLVFRIPVAADCVANFISVLSGKDNGTVQK